MSGYFCQVAGGGLHFWTMLKISIDCIRGRVLLAQALLLFFFLLQAIANRHSLSLFLLFSHLHHMDSYKIYHSIVKLLRILQSTIHPFILTFRIPQSTIPSMSPIVCLVIPFLTFKLENPQLEAEF